MPREGSKPIAGGRTAELRRSISKRRRGWRGLIRSRAVLWGAVTAAAFVIVCGTLAIWARSRPLVAVGRVMADTKTVRVPFQVVDEQATESKRNTERLRTARICKADLSVLEALKAQLENLPLAVAGKTMDQVDPDLREQFGIKADSLAALQAQVTDGTLSGAWTDRVERLYQRLRRWAPIMTAQDQQRLVESAATKLDLRVDGVHEALVDLDRVLVIGSSSLPEQVRQLAGSAINELGQRGAGFEPPLLDAIVTRLTHLNKPTYIYDQAATEAAQDRAAAAVKPIMRTYEEGTIIFRRGQSLTQAQLDRYRAELRAFRDSAPAWRLTLRRVGLYAAVAGIVLGLIGYTVAYCPRVRRNPTRAAALAALLAGAAVLACWATAMKPDMIALTALVPTVFVAVIVTIAYDQRIALAFGLLHGTLVCFALHQPVGTLALIGAGVGVAVWQLREIRDRNTIIRMGVTVALALALGELIVGLIELPVSIEAVRQTAQDAALAGFGGLLVGAVTLFILPQIEKAFDITTGMTLIELRDPKQPLLRQLQQRAPGTYNHSLNVASLGEAAADAIGADGLLTYVGALYHDIGKMNKPEYFVENQTPGLNRHDKLSPAMSLLIIVGHVKDGMELAREFNLPRSLHHFIEAHHGTTLVEYFYHRAKRQAEDSAEDGNGAQSGPEEIEYRYPGPRPRTKEVAILMLCDAVESAARAMADPTPSRIDTMVRAIANKRLMDGQFDECDLSLRDLNQIVETVSKALAAIYHGRIAYPGKKQDSMAQPVVKGLSDTEATRIDADDSQAAARAQSKSA